MKTLQNAGLLGLNRIVNVNEFDSTHLLHLFVFILSNTLQNFFFFS